MHFELPDTIVEIADTSHKDNYNKVVIQKRKCVPCTAETVITLTEDVGEDVGARLKYVLNNNNKIIRYTSTLHNRRSAIVVKSN